MEYFNKQLIFDKLTKSIDPPNFIIENLDNDNLVFLSSCHSSSHNRDGVIKSLNGEIFTSVVIKDVMNVINNKYKKNLVSIMYKVSNPNDDPNSSPESEYRDKIIDNLKRFKKNILLLDFHNMNLTRESDIDLALNNYINVKNDKELINNLFLNFAANGLTCTIEKYFKASKENNLVFESAKLNNVKAISVEIKYSLYYNTKDYVSLIYSIVSFIDNYIEKQLLLK